MFDRDFLETSVMPERALPAFFHLFKGMGLQLTASAVVYLIKHSPVWVAPIVTAKIINLITLGKMEAWDHILLLSLGLLILILQNIPTHMLYASLLNGSIRRMEARTRMCLIRKLQQLSFGYHAETRTGALQTKILRDVETVGIMVTQFINTILSTAVTVAIAMTYTLLKKPVIALFFIVTIPLTVALVRIFNKPIRKNTQNYREALEGMTVRITEALNMLPITRAHSTEEYEIEEISGKMNHVSNTGRRLDVLNGIFGASSWAMFQIFSLLSLLVSGYLALKGEIEIGDVVLYQGFFTAIVGGVSGVINVIPEITKGMNSLDSIGEVLRSHDVELNNGKAKIADFKGEFRFEDVSFCYPGTVREVLSDINLEVEAGATIAFVGESGSGKSSLINLIIGFYQATKGRVLLDGVDMRDLDLRDYRRNLSAVSQNVLLFSGTIRDNITYGLRQISEKQVINAIRDANALEFIEQLPQGLDTMLGEHGSKLSGGQRQRIAIARALIRNPKVLILDEATSALDVESERLVQEAIDRVIVGRTTFIVAHRLSTIRNADKVAVLKQGRLLEFGTHAELLAMGGEFTKLQNLYR